MLLLTLVLTKLWLASGFNSSLACTPVSVPNSSRNTTPWFCRSWSSCDFTILMLPQFNWITSSQFRPELVCFPQPPLMVVLDCVLALHNYFIHISRCSTISLSPRLCMCTSSTSWGKVAVTVVGTAYSMWSWKCNSITTGFPCNVTSTVRPSLLHIHHLDVVIHPL